MATIASANPLANLRAKLRGGTLIGTRVVADSMDLGWRGIQAAITQHTPLRESVRGICEPSLICLIYHLAGPAMLTRRIDGGPLDRGVVLPRQMCLTPAGLTAYWNHSDYPEIVRIYLHSRMYESAVHEIFSCDGSSACLQPEFALVDPLLEQLAIAVAAALRDSDCEPLYIESIANLMAAHLARTYSSRASAARIIPETKLTACKIRRVIDYVEANLEVELTLQRMAAEAEVSPLYFARAFKTTIGKSPHQYVITRRVEHAKELLRSTDLPLEEVAAAVGFCSQNHLSRMFLRHVGVPPGAYRRQ